MPGTVTRRVYFYKAIFERRTGRDSWAPVRPEPVFQYIEGLPFADAPQGRYLPSSDLNATCMHIDHVDREIAGQVANVRKSGLPRIDRRGTMRSLPLDPDEGLYEPSHFILFPDRILGFERNSYGPTAGRLGWYLESLGRSLVDRVTFAIVPRTGALDRLRRLRQVRVLKIRVARDIVERTQLLDRSLKDAFEAAKNASDAEEIEVVLTAAKFSRSLFDVPWLQNARRYLLNDRAREGTAEFLVRGEDSETGSITEVDLLAEVVMSKKLVPLESERERSVVSDRMYQAVREAYRESRDDLRRVFDG